MVSEGLPINLRVASNLRQKANQEAVSAAIQQFKNKAEKVTPPRKEPSPIEPPNPSIVSEPKLPPAPLEPEPQPKPDNRDESLPPAPSKTTKEAIPEPPSPIPPRPEPLPQPEPQPEPPPRPELPETDFQVAFVGLQNALVQEGQRLEETYKSWEQTDSMLHDWRSKPALLASRIPYIGSLLSGAAYSLAHPIKSLWQNVLLSKHFDNRNKRFSRELILALKTKDLSMTHVEIPQEFMQQALAEGKKRRNATIFTRLGSAMWDATLGNLGWQNSVQRSTLSFLQSEEANPLKQRLEQVVNDSLQKQSRLASGFTQHIEQAGEPQDLLIAKEFGEARSRLQTNPEVQQQLNINLKDLITQLHNQTLTEKTFIAQLNRYLASENFQKLLSPEQRQYFNQPEFASNLLQTAKQIHEQWDSYQQPDEREGKEGSYFDNLHFNIVIGQAEWHEAREQLRGNEKQQARERALYLELTRYDQFSATAGNLKQAMNWQQRNQGVLEQTLGTVMTSPLTAYLAGETIGGLLTSLPLGLTRMAGLIPGPVMAGISAALGTRSQLTHERQQVSRESVMGYSSEHPQQRRAELEKTLVQTRSATELYNQIKDLLNKETLNETEQQQLLLHTAHLRSRLRLTDLSTKNSRVQQNFIDYSDTNNQELLDWCQENNFTPDRLLRSSLIQAQEKLIRSGISVENVNSQLALFTDVVTAQLLNASQDVAQLEQALKEMQKRYHERGLTNLDTEASANQITQILALMKTNHITVEEAESLIHKDRCFQRYLTTQMVYMGVKTAAFSLASGQMMGYLNPVTYATSELHSALSQQDYAHTWAQVWQGKADAGTELSLAQNIIQTLNDHLKPESPFNGPTEFDFTDSAGVSHEFNINGLNPALRFSGNLLIDQRDGQVVGLINQSNGEFVTQVADWQSRMDMPQIQPGEPDYSLAFDYNSPIHEQTVVIDGQTVNVQIPQGTQLFQDIATDPQGRTYDLQMVNPRNGLHDILIQDIVFKEDGTLDYAPHSDFEIKIEPVATLEASPEASPIEQTINTEAVTINAQKFWDNAADYRVVHAKAELPVAITNHLVQAENSSSDHPFAVEFRFPESMVHNPNLNKDQSLNTFYQDGKLGLLFQTVELDTNGNETTRSIFLPVEETFDHNGRTYYRTVLDPTSDDMITLPHAFNGQNTIKESDLAQLILNEEYLRQQSEGALNSEMTYEGRQAFNLGHQMVDNKIIDGRILGGYFDTESKAYGHLDSKTSGTFIAAAHAIHGSGDLKDITIETPPEPLPEPLPEPPPSEIGLKISLNGQYQEPGTPEIITITPKTFITDHKVAPGLYSTRMNLELGQKKKITEPRPTEELEQTINLPSRIDLDGQTERETTTEYGTTTVMINGQKYQASVASDVGGTRSEDEDFSLITSGKLHDLDYSFLGIFDGMGGHAQGNMASEIAAEAWKKTLLAYHDLYKDTDLPEISQLFVNDLTLFFKKIFIELAQEKQLDQSAGTTMTAIFSLGGKTFTINCGDSRIYRQRANQLEQVTNDHSMVFTEWKAGTLSDEEANKAQGKNIIYRSLNLDGKTKIDVAQLDLLADDSILLTCDGIPEAFDNEYTHNPQTLLNALNVANLTDKPALELISQALNLTNNKAADNLSVIILKKEKESV